MYDDSDGELEDRSRGYPIDESHRVTLRFDTEKHINPRTGEVIDGVKHDKNQLSYDVQNIEAVAPANVTRRYGVKENYSSQSSTKDSAYGSMEVKLHTSKSSSSYKNEYKQNLSVDTSKNSPSRSLSATTIPQNKSPLLDNAQRIQRTEEVYTKEMESLKGSSSTLQSQTSSTKEKSNNILPRNGYPGYRGQVSPYTSMKDTAYDAVVRSDSNLSKDAYRQMAENPYSSSMNIVQGQMMISPHGTDPKNNVVNVSVTSLK